MIRKCDFCEHHRLPVSKKTKVCCTCDGVCNFKEKIRMHPVQRAEYQNLVRLEDWINNIAGEYDRKTALFIFNTLNEHIRVKCNMSDDYVYVIKADIFDAIKNKILNTKKEE